MAYVHSIVKLNLARSPTTLIIEAAPTFHFYQRSYHYYHVRCFHRQVLGKLTNEGSRQRKPQNKKTHIANREARIDLFVCSVLIGYHASFLQFQCVLVSWGQGKENSTCRTLVVASACYFTTNVMPSIDTNVCTIKQTLKLYNLMESQYAFQIFQKIYLTDSGESNNSTTYI